VALSLVALTAIVTEQRVEAVAEGAKALRFASAERADAN